MYTAESLSAVLIYFIDLFGEIPSPQELKGIVNDRACDLLPFVNDLLKKGTSPGGEKMRRR